MSVKQPTMVNWLNAALVAQKSIACAIDLIDFTKSLSILHRTPESDWPDLVVRMRAGGWTHEQTDLLAVATSVGLVPVIAAA